MKKKLLGFILAIAFGLGCAGILVACGSSAEDEATANAVITTLDLKYGENSKAQTVHYSDYQVVGKPIVNGKAYTVNWSVSSDYSGYKDYVSVGKMDKDTMVTVSIKQADEVINYTLTASVKVGGAKKSIDFARKIAAAVPDGDGTFNSPFSVTQVFKIGDKLENGKYYDGQTETGVAETNAKRVYIRGYVVDVGKSPDQGGTYKGGVQYPYISDVYSEDMDSYSDGALRVGSLTFNEYLKADYLLEKGEQIILSGYIETYNNKVSVWYVTGQNILCEWRSTYVDNTTPEEKIELAKNDTVLAPTFFTKATQISLPSESHGATLTWSVAPASEHLTVANGKLNVVSIPSTETDYTVTVTISCGTAQSDTKEFRVTLASTLGVTNDGTEAHPYTPSEANRVLRTLAKGGYSEQIYVKGYVVDAGEWSSERWNGVYLADTMESTDQLYVYRIVKDDTYLKAEGDLEEGLIVTLTGFLNNYNGTLELNYKDKVSVTCVSRDDPRLNDEEKAQEAADAVTLPAMLREDFAFPQAAVTGATLSFVSNKHAVLEVDTTNSKFVVHRGTADETVTVTVTASYNGKTATATAPLSVVVKRNIPASEIEAGNNVEVTVAEYGTKHEWTVSSNKDDDPYYETIVLDQNITATSSCTSPSSYGRNTGKFYGTDWRIYQSENASVTLTAGSNAKILTVKVTYTSHTSNGGILMRADGSKKTYASGAVIEVDDTSFTFTVSSSGSNGQVRISKIEVVYSGGREMNADEKIEKALDAVADTLTIAEPGVHPLVDSTVDGVTFVWSSTDPLAATYPVSSQDGTLTVNALPDLKTTMIITVTASCDGATTNNVTKNVTVTIEPSFDFNGQSSVQLNLDFVTGFDDYAKDDAGKAWTYGSHDLPIGTVVTGKTPSGTVNFSYAGKQSGTITDQPVSAAKAGAPAYITISVNGVNISEVEFVLAQWTTKVFSNIHIEYNAGENNWEYASSSIAVPGTIASIAGIIPAGTTKVRLVMEALGTSNVQVGLTSAKLTVVPVATSTHTHNWTYTPGTGLTHSRVCTVAGCDFGTGHEIEEACTIVENECAFCEASHDAEDILAALGALTAGQALPGTYALTGQITEAAIDTQNKNCTFVMKVGEDDVLIQAYRAAGTGYETIAVGDTITVTGLLRNYNGTLQFDQGATVSNIQKSEHVHSELQNPTYNDDEWTHTGTCTTPGCTYPNGSMTEDCDIEYDDGVHKCKVCGHQFTVDDILDRLASGKTMKGTYQLTGKVITTVAKSTQAGSNDIKFDMTVTGSTVTKTVQAYYVTPGSETVEILDTVTISGPLTKYGATLEFNGGTVISVSKASAQEKVVYALSKVNNISITKAGDYTLPVPTTDVTGVTFSWEQTSTSNEAYKLDSTKTKIECSVLPDDTVTIKLTLTANCGNDSLQDNTKEITVTIKKPVEPVSAGSISFGNSSTSDEAGSTSFTFTKDDKFTVAYAQASASASDWTNALQSNHIRIYRNSMMTISGTTGFVKLVFTFASSSGNPGNWKTTLDAWCTTWNSSHADNIVTVEQNGSNVTLQFESEVTSISITHSANACRLASLEFFALPTE